MALREIRLPLQEPFGISSGVTTERRILLIEAIDVDGAIAWGECVASEDPNYSPETIDTAWIIIRDQLAPRILGHRVDRAADVHAILEKDVRGHWMSRAAIEMTMWALEAEMLGVPLAKLLGGERKTIATGISLGLLPTSQALIGKARASLDMGYRKVKIKIKPGQDFDYVRETREALGPDAPLMVDANNAYSLDDIDHLKQFDSLGLMMIEQPLDWDDVVQHAKLQRELETPVCLDESITSVAHARTMIELDSGRIINIKPGRVGGFSESIAIHDLCEQNDIPVWCGGMLESGVGRAYNVALASMSNFTLPGDLSPSARYWAQDIVEPEWTMDAGGNVQVPWDKPGLGIEIDRERIESLTVRNETIQNK
jgi:O-succinylbenzoate synthase